MALPDGGNRLNLRLALEKGFPWTRVRLESGAVEADLRLKPLATILSAEDVERLQRFGRTRGSKATASIEAPADKDARRAVHTTLAAAFRACETKTLDAVWKSTSELGYPETFVNLYAIEQARSRGRRRVDGVGRAKFDIHTGSTGARSRRGGAAAASGGATARAGRSSCGASWKSATPRPSRSLAVWKSTSVSRAPSLDDDAAVLAPSSGEAPASPRVDGVESTRRFPHRSSGPPAAAWACRRARSRRRGSRTAAR